MIRSLAILLIFTLVACGGEGSGGRYGGPGGVVATKRAPVDGPGACGVRDAWVVTDVSGVRLSRPAIMTMNAARALDRWVRETAIPAVGRRGGGLVELTVASHYACRTRNSRSGARLSEHARGRAIDISSVVMRDGSRVTVLDGWNKSGDSRLLRRLHKGACGPFGTVLGPESDQHHQDHFHFDVADYRSGPYCR
jgi:hypothetical protein